MVLSLAWNGVSEETVVLPVRGAYLPGLESGHAGKRGSLKFQLTFSLARPLTASIENVYG